jgi:hypothetical protein
MDKDFIKQVFLLGGLCVATIGSIVEIIDKNSFLSYRFNKDETFKKNNEDRAVTLNSLKEILCYAWKLITGKVIDGSGIQAKRILQNPDINDVTKINVNNLCVRIVCDPKQGNMFEIEGDNNILHLIDYRVYENCLYIDNSNFALHPKCNLVFICKLKKIEEITLSGNSALSKFSRFCYKNICGYCSRKPTAGAILQTNDLTINLSDNARMSASEDTGEPTIHRNIKANVSGNGYLSIGNCLNAELIASNKAQCVFGCHKFLDIKLCDEAFLRVCGGYKLTGKMDGYSWLFTDGYTKDDVRVEISFSNKGAQWFLNEWCYE